MSGSDTDAPRLVLHVGPAKTATSFIQGAFVANRTELAAAGVWYPEVFTIPLYDAHHALTAGLDVFGVPVPPSHRVDAAAELRRLDHHPAPTVVLSAESMSTFRAAQWAELLEPIERRQPEVVVFLRRWSESLPSRWHQLVRRRDAPPLFTYLEEQTAPPSTHLPLLDRLCEAVGIDQLSIIRLDRDAGGPDPFAQLCSSVLGVDPPGLRPERNQQLNEALPIAATEVLRLIHLRSGGRLVDAHRQFIGTRQRGGTNAVAKVEALAAERLHAAPTRRVDWLDEASAAADAEVVERYGHRIVNPDPSGLLFRPVGDAVAEDRAMPDADLANDTDVARAVDRLILRFRVRQQVRLVRGR